MKRFCLLVVAMILSVCAFAQAKVDVVYLKNGSIIKGLITEQMPPARLTIKTLDGSVFIFTYAQIDRIERENAPEGYVPIEVAPDPKRADEKEPEYIPPHFEDYGGSVAVGVSLGGGGLVGVPVRLSFSRKFALEAGIFVRPFVYSKDPNASIAEDEDFSQYRIPVLPHFSGGFDVFFAERNYRRSEKITKNGMCFRIGATFGSDDFTRTTFIAGWTREKFDVARPQRSMINAFGGGLAFYGGVNSPLGIFFDAEIPFIPVIYWKVHWNYYVRKERR